VSITAKIICAATGPDPANGVEPGHRGCRLAELGVHPVLHDGDVGGDAVDPLQQLDQQGRVVLDEPAGRRLGQAIGVGPQPAAVQLGQHRRIALTGDQRGHDRPPEAPNGSLTTTDSLISAFSAERLAVAAAPF
jgi:hypothetical protein